MHRFLIVLFVSGWLLAIVAACGFQPGGGGDSVSTAVAAQQTMLARQTMAAYTDTPSPSPGPTERLATAAAATATAAALSTDVPLPPGPQQPPSTPELVSTEVGRSAEPAPLAAEDLAGNLLTNGAFEDLAGWGTLNQSNVPDKTRLEDGGNFVLWERTQSNSDGGAVGLFQDLDVDLSGAEQLMLCLDVWVGYHTLRNTGRRSDVKGGMGEMPVQITVHYLDANGNQERWSHGFLIQNVGDTTLQNYTLVPAAEWSHVCLDLMDDEVRKDPLGEQTLPRPSTITQVRLFGSGWDFKGAVGNALLQAK